MSENEIPLNQILYGPPGTGKTYITKEMAVKICDGKYYEEHKATRDEILKRYKDWLAKKELFLQLFISR